MAVTGRFLYIPYEKGFGSGEGKSGQTSYFTFVRVFGRDQMTGEKDRWGKGEKDQYDLGS